MNVILIGVMVYVVLQLGIAVIVSRRTASEDDYLLAGRNLGLPMATMTIFATWFGAETCIGAAGNIYENGLSGGRVDPFGYALCILVMGLFFATLFWKLHMTTVCDFFRLRYGATAERLSAILLVPSSLMWASAQILAFGNVLAASSPDLNLDVAVGIAAAVVIAYVAMGGLMADAVTDFLQGGVMLLGLLLLAALVFFSGREAAAPVEEVALNPERLRFLPQDESWFLSLEVLAVPILGSVFTQELVARTLASRSPQIARKACFLAFGVYALLGLIPIGLGLYGPALVPGLEAGEQVLPALAQAYMPTVLYIVFAGALVSAILSTVDSALLACGSMASHNLVLPLLRNPSEKMKVRIARGCVVGFGIIAWLVAERAESVIDLVYSASSISTAGIVACIIFGILLPRRGGQATALAALAVGATCYALLHYYLAWETPFLLSIGAAALVFLAGALVEPGRGLRAVAPDPAPETA